MTPQELEPIIEGVVSVLSRELRRAIKLSGNAINRDMPLYIGSEHQVTQLSLEIMRELNRQNLFVKNRGQV